MEIIVILLSCIILALVYFLHRMRKKERDRYDMYERFVFDRKVESVLLDMFYLPFSCQHDGVPMSSTILTYEVYLHKIENEYWLLYDGDYPVDFPTYALFSSHEMSKYNKDEFYNLKELVGKMIYVHLNRVSQGLEEYDREKILLSVNNRLKEMVCVYRLS